MKLNNFLNPKYIAVIGASSKPGKVGRIIFDNIISSKKAGVFPINHQEKKVAGHKAFSSIEDLELKDWKNLLVVIAIPAKFVLKEVEKCARLGVKDIIIVSAGFKEIGGEGEKLEKEIADLAKDEGLNVLGPNCLGMINGGKSLNITFSDYSLKSDIKRKHNIAFLSQSGAIGSYVLDFLKNKNIALSYFLSLGNKAGLNENDFLDYLYKDKKTDLIILYLEEISQGPRFVEIVSRISKIKPVAVLKAGRSPWGEKMAMSHTGSLAGSHEVALAALKRSGAIILENITQINNLMRLIKGPVKEVEGHLAIISNAGGMAVLASDEAFEKKLSLAKFSDKTVAKLKQDSIKFIDFKNPLDILGDADAKRYERALDIVLSDKKVSSVLALLTPQSMTEDSKTAEAISRLARKYPDKIVTTCFLGSAGVASGKKVLAKNLIANFDSPEEAIDVLSKLSNYLDTRKELKVFKSFSLEEKSSSLRVLDYIDSFRVLKGAGINVASARKLEKKTLDKMKYPIVIKFTGPDFLHKFDKQAVFLNVENKQSARKILDIFDGMLKEGKISSDNVPVFQSQLRKKTELILGFKRDLVFGPVVLLGFGGTYAELYNDTVIEIADLDRRRVQEMIKSLKCYPVLNGFRGQKKANMSLLVDTILNFSKLVRENKDILELDINPLFVDDKKVVAVDVRIIMKK
jgi:acetate---CoA ligase (ADP-forming)